ncbi:hypothetical protein AX279_19805 [Pseudomonas sp. J237]|nr:hypothetical protein AX279_19805 [Pseudomonas sp. J237]
MTARRPIVSVDGERKQLPAGDSLHGLPLYVLAYQQSGAFLRLALNTNYSLVAYTQAGAGLAIQVVLNG